MHRGARMLADMYSRSSEVGTSMPGRMYASCQWTRTREGIHSDADGCFRSVNAWVFARCGGAVQRWSHLGMRVVRCADACPGGVRRFTLVLCRGSRGRVGPWG